MYVEFAYYIELSTHTAVVLVLFFRGAPPVLGCNYKTLQSRSTIFFANDVSWSPLKHFKGSLYRNRRNQNSLGSQRKKNVSFAFFQHPTQILFPSSHLDTDQLQLKMAAGPKHFRVFRETGLRANFISTEGGTVNLCTYPIPTVTPRLVPLTRSQRSDTAIDKQRTKLEYSAGLAVNT